MAIFNSYVKLPEGRQKTVWERWKFSREKKAARWSPHVWRLSYVAHKKYKFCSKFNGQVSICSLFWWKKRPRSSQIPIQAISGWIYWIILIYTRYVSQNHQNTQKTITGWWFGTFFIFLYIGNFIIPTDELIFFRGVGLNHQPDQYIPWKWNDP